MAKHMTKTPISHAANDTNKRKTEKENAVAKKREQDATELGRCKDKWIRNFSDEESDENSEDEEEEEDAHEDDDDEDGEMGDSG